MLEKKQEEMRLHLEERLRPRGLKLRFNRNRVTYLTASKVEGDLKVSIHEAFLSGDQTVWDSIVQFIKRPTAQVRRDLDYFIENVPRELWAQYTRKKRCPERTVKGAWHDLSDILEQTLSLSFEGGFPGELPQITWGRSGRPGRNVCLGSYHADQNLIRIHRVLDHEDVPVEFIMSVIHHELLHVIHRPTYHTDRRRQIHTKEFLAAEKKFPLYQWSRIWEKKYLDSVIRRQRRRKAS